MLAHIVIIPIAKWRSGMATWFLSGWEKKKQLYEKGVNKWAIFSHLFMLSGKLFQVVSLIVRCWLN
jgi:hypothetical protein